MAKLYLEVTNQTLVVHSDIERIVENSLNYLEYEIINKTDDWDSFVKKIVVTYDNDSWEHSYPSVEEERVIHPGAIHAPGFTISVVGTKTEDKDGETVVTGRIPTNSVVIKVWPSGSINGDNVQHDFPGEPADFETQFNTYKAKTDDHEQRIQAIEDRTLDEEKIKKLQEDISTNTSNIEALKKEVETNTSSIETLNTNINTIQTDISTIKTDIQKLEIITKIENNILVMEYKTLE